MRRGELDCVEVVSEIGGSWASEVGSFAQVEVWEFDAEEEGGKVAEVFDGVSLDDTATDAKGSEMGGGTGNGRGWVLVDDVYGAGVVEVDVNGGGGGMVVDRDLLVGAVLDTDDVEGVIGEDGVVVGWEARAGALREDGQRAR